MANKIAGNYALQAANHSFSMVWKLTRCMKASGWTVKAHSDGTTKVSAGTNNNDSWGTNADPMLDSYPAFDAAAAWIVLEGPKTLKLILSGAPTGTHVRGEQVTQANTSATGELLGIVWDSGTSTGWAVVMPRTGTFNGTDVVTGAVSAATFTPSALRTFTREVMFAKQSSSTVNGTCNYICANESTESASLFSTLAASAGCTATVPPGQGGTSNAFPAIAMNIRGTAGSVSHADWVTSSVSMGSFAQICSTNATPGSGVSADGTFWATVVNTATTGVTNFFGFFRLDDTEPGDVDPFVWFWQSNNTIASFSRTANTSQGNNVYTNWQEFLSGFSAVLAHWKGYLARDCSVTSRDVVTPYLAAYRNVTYNAFQVQLLRNQPSVYRVANHPAATPPVVREPFSISADNTTMRCKKGNTRWMSIVGSLGLVYDTFDAKQWLCVCATNGNTNPAIIVGPYDGTTTPST